MKRRTTQQRKLRDRRSGKSPYVTHRKKPYNYSRVSRAFIDKLKALVVEKVKRYGADGYRMAIIEHWNRDRKNNVDV